MVRSMSRAFKMAAVAPSNQAEISIEDQLEWEDYKGDIPFWKHAVAGSCAGVAEHVSMFPLDTAKTRLQAWSTVPEAERTFSNALRNAYHERGFFGLFRGAAAISSGCVPAHAALFGVYELMKDALDLDDEGHHPVKAAVCGATATLCHDAILTPLDVVKQRLQLGCYNSSLHCFQSVVKQEGIFALFRSMPTTVAMNIPFGSIMVAVNESLKEIMGIRGSDSASNDTTPEGPAAVVIQANADAATGFSPVAAAATGNHSSSTRVAACASTCPPPSEAPPSKSSPIPSTLPLYFLCAGISGGVASALTTPFDVIKTRLQTQDCGKVLAPPPCCNPAQAANCSVAQQAASAVAGAAAQAEVAATTFAKGAPKYSGFLSTAKSIFQEEGLKGLYRGSFARVGLAAPSTAICWGTYESVKYLLGAKAFGKEPINNVAI